MAGNHLRYLAVLSDEPGLLGDFYARHLSLEELGRSQAGDVSLTDGFYNLSFLKRRPELNELHSETGLHHIGFQVADMPAVNQSYLSLIADGIIVPEPGGLAFGDQRFFDPECSPVTVSAGSYGVEAARRVRCPRIAHIALNALFPQRALEFYVRVFGLREVSTSFTFRGEGRPNRFAGDGVTNLAIHPFYTDNEGHEARYGVNHFGFLVDDIEARLDSLSREVPVATRPSGRPFAEYRLTDPEGNRFDLSQAKGWEVDFDTWDRAVA